MVNASQLVFRRVKGSRNLASGTLAFVLKHDMIFRVRFGTGKGRFGAYPSSQGRGYHQEGARQAICRLRLGRDLFQQHF